jgi:hypothetical protein
MIWNGRKYLQTTYLMRSQSPKIRKSYFSIANPPNNRIKKWAKDLNRHFSKEDIQMANRYLKMLNVTCHQGNANGNHKVSPHTCQDGYDQKNQKIAIVGDDVEK